MMDLLGAALLTLAEAVRRPSSCRRCPLDYTERLDLQQSSWFLRAILPWPSHQVKVEHGTPAYRYHIHAQTWGQNKKLNIFKESTQQLLLRLKTCRVTSFSAQRLALSVIARSFWLLRMTASHFATSTERLLLIYVLLIASSLPCWQQSARKNIDKLTREADLARCASTSSLSVYSLPTFVTKIDDLLKSWPCSLRRFGCYRYQARQSSSDLQPIYRHKFRAALLPMAESC